ncbi:ACP S-malonyltransferase [Mesoterricola sediminis]|uniref:Malonyl CoA-acyl carrier protein transacylase n=1 Tax=Mesoterricola sediminis TaxID=2927980 RepID=A0AA48GMA3_9BACT|nr:ACP S-malonyltransferase [Mesoterricola sediminis]BDU75701.1 malonyl CoA-acyl carrier protein transacylase [Mesoterricola sediminis]
MSKTAWLFPGQGSQAVGMGMALAEAEPAAKAVLREADEALGFTLSTVMAQGPEEVLKLTEHTQPAILTHSTMVVRAYGDRLPRPDFVAGHSLGEYSALVASGALTFADAVRTVRERGQAMQTAVPVGVGAMAAILGAAAADVEAACAQAQSQTGKVAVPANFNGPGQIVIAGHVEGVDAAIELLKARGVRKMMKLPVSAPFHSPLMEPAQAAMAPVLAALAFAKPVCPLANNVDAALVSEPEALRDGLVRQIPGAVRWEALTALLLQQGVTTFYELGPGKVLSGLVKRQAKEAGLEVAAFSIGGPEDLAALA